MKIAYVVPSDVDLWYPEEAVTLWAGLNNLLQDQIHPIIAVDKMSV